MTKKEYDALRYKRKRTEILAQTSGYAKANKHIRKAIRARFAKRHPEKEAANAAKRRAEKKQRTPKWLTKTNYQQIDIFYAAAAALTKEFGISMEVDHIIPLNGKNVSGLHVPWNLQVITEKENSRKGNKL